MNTMLSKIRFAVVGAVTVLAFQNCGMPGQLQTSGSSVNTQGNQQLGLVASSTSTSNPVVSRYVTPTSIRFGNIGTAYVDCAITNSVGSVANCPNYLFTSDYTLDLKQWVVQDRSGHTVLNLSSSQISQIKSILNGSIIATASAIGYQPPSDMPAYCPETLKINDYAVITTDQGENFELQGVSCGGKELFNYASRQPAGLSDFLYNLLNQLNAGKIGII